MNGEIPPIAARGEQRNGTLDATRRREAVDIDLVTGTSQDLLHDHEIAREPCSILPADQIDSGRPRSPEGTQG